MLIKHCLSSDDKIYGVVKIVRDGEIYFSSLFYCPVCSAKVYVFCGESFENCFNYYANSVVRIKAKDFLSVGFIIVIDSSVCLYAGKITHKNILFVQAKEIETHNTGNLILNISNNIFKVKSVSFYEKIKHPLNELFVYAERVIEIEKEMPNTKWVKIQKEDKIEVVGKIYTKDEKLCALAIGCIKNIEDITNDNNVKILKLEGDICCEFAIYNILSGKRETI